MQFTRLSATLIQRSLAPDAGLSSLPLWFILEMAFGFSPQDIVQGIAVARRICEAHFVRERRAGKSDVLALSLQ